MALKSVTPEFNPASASAAKLWQDFMDIWHNFSGLISFWDMSKFLWGGVQAGDQRKFPKQQFSSSQIYFHPSGHNHSGDSVTGCLLTDGVSETGAIRKAQVDKNSTHFLWGSLTAENSGTFMRHDFDYIILVHSTIPIPAGTFLVASVTSLPHWYFRSQLEVASHAIFTATPGFGNMDLEMGSPDNRRCIAASASMFYRAESSADFNGSNARPYTVVFHDATGNMRLHKPRILLGTQMPGSTPVDRVLHCISAWAITYDG